MMMDFNITKLEMIKEKLAEKMYVWRHPSPGKLTQFSLYHGHWSIKEIQEIALQSYFPNLTAIFAIFFAVVLSRPPS